jgi:hypothetical protein
VLASDAKLQSTLREPMLETCRRGNKDEVREICAAFAARGSKEDVTEMERLLKHENADIREAAARAIIHIARRHHKP